MDFPVVAAASVLSFALVYAFSAFTKGRPRPPASQNLQTRLQTFFRPGKRRFRPLILIGSLIATVNLGIQLWTVATEGGLTNVFWALIAVAVLILLITGLRGDAQK
jgi:hypothetical protein